MEQITPENLSKIKERIAQAASDGLSKSMKLSYSDVMPSSMPSSSPINTVAISSTTPPNRSSVQNIKSNLWNFNKIDLIPMNLNNYENYTVSDQEQLLILELIYCLNGIRGAYIKPEKCTNDLTPIKFTISDCVQNSFKHIIMEILPVANYYIIIKKFTEYASSINNGQILQALSASLRNLLRDYYIFLVQLESEQQKHGLSLHKMLYYIRPTMAILEILKEIACEIYETNINGGKVLTLLYDKILSLTGDENGQKILIHLTEMAALPYIQMLELWILKGIILDPYEEFLIGDNEIMRREDIETDDDHYSADYWEKRYAVRNDRIPKFLESCSDIILRTGKYLNVIRQSGKNVLQYQQVQQQHLKDNTTDETNNRQKQLIFTPMNHNHLLFIQNAYQIASKTLLQVLVNENDLMGHLLSVKRYLLIQQGDFITQFMDASEDELLKNVDKILPMKLENLLGLTLRLSSAKHDPYKDDLHCQLFPIDLVNQMSKIHLAGTTDEEYWNNEKIDLSGLECFAFRYEVQWPVSLVLNHFTILKYQMLFRHLFYCKHVERQLCKVWKDNNNTKKFASDTVELYRSAFTLRQRMTHAIQNLEYYMLIEVIEPAWHDFLQKMEKVENVDDVLVVHQDFLEICLQNCMLRNPDLLHSITKLCNICLNFCKFIQTESTMGPSDTFSERIKRFDLEFTFQLIGLLKQINDLVFENPTGKFINLIHRINFNSFYNDQLESLCTKKSTGID